MSVLFQKATKKQSMLRLALEGPAGYGKTYTALVIGTGLAKAEGKRLAFVDTEFGSAAKYADLFDFDTIALDPPFHPDRAVEAISAAAEAGYGAVIVDSLSHFWVGEGGTLDLVDQIARTKYKNDSHRAWKDAGEIQQRLTDAILRAPLHVIAAMRTKKDYVREEVDGKTKIRAAGTKTVQRDEFDYEFDLIGRFDTPTVMAIVKSRYADLPPETVVEKPGQAFVDGLIRFLGEGEALASEKAQQTLTTLIDTLTSIDGSHDWAAVAEKYAQREFKHGRDRLTEPEIGQTIIQFQAQLEKLSKAAASEPTEPAAEPEPEAQTALEDESPFKAPVGAGA